LPPARVDLPSTALTDTGRVRYPARSVYGSRSLIAMLLNRLVLLPALLLALPLALLVPAAAQTLPTTRLTAGIHVITAEVAASDPARMRGLMFREKLGPNAGMLFVFDDKNVQCMWMRNTLIPLSVAFIEDDGRIVNVEDMQPRTETSHCARAPVRYALEMELGWFAKRGLTAGTKVAGLPAR
jgi:uncharacterized membrane protein (UPF0127 family)